MDSFEFFKEHLLKSIYEYREGKKEALIRVGENDSSNILRGNIYTANDIELMVNNSYKEAQQRSIFITAQHTIEG